MRNLFRKPFAILLISLLIFSCTKKENNIKENELQYKTTSKTSQDILAESINKINKYYSVKLSNEDYIETVTVQDEEEQISEMSVVIFKNENTIYASSFNSQTKKFISVTSNLKLNDEIHNFTIKGGDEVDIEKQITSAPLSDCNGTESCEGCHYRIMKEIIAQDGDSMYMCDKLGDACNDAVMVAALVHCWYSH
ncbi:hypothetical protein LX95_01465 [Mesonia algae]|uniref:Uncharacterized protein n=1 Tax=Mesonia algae TaxID=213248 RepID=A0A2W7I4G7_9FLAO|nr:hypothetical protein [Mesonia algae]PZW41781.1 hypothetical protein LX95_01465 [Mesonia algae]